MSTKFVPVLKKTKYLRLLTNTFNLKFWHEQHNFICPLHFLLQFRISVSRVAKEILAYAFSVVLHGLYCTKQHKRNANYKNSPGIAQHRQHLRRSTFQSPIYIYFFAPTRTNLEPKCLLDPRLSRSTRTYATYACFKRLGRLKWWVCFGRTVNASHNFFQVWRLRSPIYRVYFSLF